MLCDHSAAIARLDPALNRLPVPVGLREVFYERIGIVVADRHIGRIERAVDGRTIEHSRRGKTLEEFILRVAEEMEAVDELTDDVMNATADRLD